MIWLNWWLGALLTVASSGGGKGRRGVMASPQLFAFTQPSYNVSLPENARGEVFAVPQLALGAKMGVYIPTPGAGGGAGGASAEAASVRFKVVEGDTKHYFAASARLLGDFAFLRIRIRSASDATLNRELKEDYQLLVKATLQRQGSHSLETMVAVNVHISDENDLVPLFLPSSYEATISDDTPAFTTVTQVFASDADAGLNGQVYFRLADDDVSDTFAVHPVTGAVTLLRRLDLERDTSQFVLTVLAEDRTSRLTSSTSEPPSAAQVKIAVTRSNHHAPVLTALEVNAVSRRNHRRQTAAVVRVSDADGVDVGAGQIADVRLVLNDSLSSWFTLDVGDASDVYLLTTLPGVPFADAVDSALVTVTAVDNGQPARHGSLLLTIPLSDSGGNHSAPLEIKGAAADVIEFAVNETVPVSTPVGFLELSGADAWRRQVAWGIKTDADNPDNPVPFQINSETGVIRVSRALDYERQQSYEFTVLVTDVTQDAEKRVRVVVHDENDNDPVFIEESKNVQLSVGVDTPAETVDRKSVV